MTIRAYVQGKESEGVGIEGAVNVQGNSLAAHVTPDLTTLIDSNPDKPLVLSKEPGGFSVIVHDMTKPCGLVLADTAVIYPPIRLLPPVEQK